MIKIAIGFIAGVILVVPQTRATVVQIGANLLELVGSLGTYLFSLI